MTCKPVFHANFLIVVSLSLAILSCQFAQAQVRSAPSITPPLFLPVAIYDSGGIFAVSVAVADLNGDRKPDLVVANKFSSSVGVLLGKGDGTFQLTASYSSGGPFAQSVAIADLNGDAKPDVVVVNVLPNGDPNTVGVLLGNGDGTFQPAASYDSGGQSARSATVGDVNGDSKPDLVVPNSDSNTVGALLGNGNGTFQPGVSYNSGGYSPRSVAVADVNSDGKPDLLVANLCINLFQCEGIVGVLIGNGDGTFQPVVTYNPGGDNSTSLAVADVNGDGRLDAVVANACGSPACSGDGSVGALLGNGDGTFQPGVSYDSGGLFPRSVAVADLNGDAKPDVVVINLIGPVGVLPGNGDGTFQSALGYSSGGIGPESVAIADVNADTKPDLLVANSDSSTVGVLLNNTPFDTTPPVITLSATPKVLWPPNGKMVPVTFSITITDTGSGVNVHSAAYAVKDEYGEVQPTGAITLGPGGNYSFTVLLQASRRGSDLDGRRYTINVRARDNAGNSGSKARAVTVPHDQEH